MTDQPKGPAVWATFTHEVPTGTRLPNGTRYIRSRSAVLRNTFVGPLTVEGDDYVSMWGCWLEAPLLPDRTGAIIADVLILRGVEVSFDHLERASARDWPYWFGVDSNGYLWSNIQTSEIQEWSPATIVVDHQKG